MALKKRLILSIAVFISFLITLFSVTAYYCEEAGWCKCNNNGICGMGEYCDNCPNDCPTSSGGCCDPDFYPFNKGRIDHGIAYGTQTDYYVCCEGTRYKGNCCYDDIKQYCREGTTCVDHECTYTSQEETGEEAEEEAPEQETAEPEQDAAEEPAPGCGDSSCGSDEDCRTCPADCNCKAGECCSPYYSDYADSKGCVASGKLAVGPAKGLFADRICCNGEDYSGDCCSDSNCDSGETCHENHCKTEKEIEELTMLRKDGEGCSSDGLCISGHCGMVNDAKGYCCEAGKKCCRFDDNCPANNVCSELSYCIAKGKIPEGLNCDSNWDCDSKNCWSQGPDFGGYCCDSAKECCFYDSDCSMDYKCDRSKPIGLHEIYHCVNPASMCGNNKCEDWEHCDNCAKDCNCAEVDEEKMEQGCDLGIGSGSMFSEYRGKFRAVGKDHNGAVNKLRVPLGGSGELIDNQGGIHGYICCGGSDYGMYLPSKIKSRGFPDCCTDEDCDTGHECRGNKCQEMDCNIIFNKGQEYEGDSTKIKDEMFRGEPAKDVTIPYRGVGKYSGVNEKGEYEVYVICCDDSYFYKKDIVEKLGIPDCCTDEDCDNDLECKENLCVKASVSEKADAAEEETAEAPQIPELRRNVLKSFAKKAWAGVQDFFKRLGKYSREAAARKLKEEKEEEKRRALEAEEEKQRQAQFKKKFRDFWPTHSYTKPIGYWIEWNEFSLHHMQENAKLVAAGKSITISKSLLNIAGSFATGIGWLSGPAVLGELWTISETIYGDNTNAAVVNAAEWVEIFGMAGDVGGAVASSETAMNAIKSVAGANTASKVSSFVGKSTQQGVSAAESLGLNIVGYALDEMVINDVAATVKSNAFEMNEQAKMAYISNELVKLWGAYWKDSSTQTTENVKKIMELELMFFAIQNKELQVRKKYWQNQVGKVDTLISFIPYVKEYSAKENIKAIEELQERNKDEIAWRIDAEKRIYR